MRQINQLGLNLIKNFEGCKLSSYKDIGGILTIGYGHTGTDVSVGQSINQDQAILLLKNDLIKFECGVEKLVKIPINDNKFSALICFAYNIGLGNLQNSTLLKKLNKNDINGASNQFLVWNKVNGKLIAGLARRREAEKTLFLTPI